MPAAETPIPPDLEPSGARKADHLRIAAGDGVVHHRGTGLGEVRLRHRALPGRDLAEVALGADVLGARLRAPVFISAMTGGTREARVINERLARAAADHGIAMTLGSGRALLDDPSLLRTYRSRHRPPLLLANLGAVQLAGRDGVERALTLVDLVGADGLSVHLNPVQEAVQPEGEAAFGGVAAAIERAVTRLAPLPVVAKEVGFGMDPADVTALADAGVAAVDVAGAGGTNWALVEGRRDPAAGAVADAFADWGVGTLDALRGALSTARGLPVVASGGVRDGVEAAKCLALGAAGVGLARPLLRAAQDDRAGEVLGTLLRQLRVATWAAGAAAVTALGPEHLAVGSPA
jgi:isopentenyl-diphosphate delta-isomerase